MSERVYITASGCEIGLGGTKLSFTVTRGTRFPRAVNEIRTRGIRSGCAFPLTTVHRRLGVRFLGSEDVDAYSEQDVSFLSLVADQVALAVDDTLNFVRRRDNLMMVLPSPGGR